MITPTNYIIINFEILSHCFFNYNLFLDWSLNFFFWLLLDSFSNFFNWLLDSFNNFFNWLLDRGSNLYVSYFFELLSLLLDRSSCFKNNFLLIWNGLCISISIISFLIGIISCLLDISFIFCLLGIISFLVGFNVSLSCLATKYSLSCQKSRTHSLYFRRIHIKIDSVQRTNANTYKNVNTNVLPTKLLFIKGFELIFHWLLIIVALRL